MDASNRALVQRLVGLGHKPDAVTAAANQDWPERVTNAAGLVKRRLEHLAASPAPRPQPPAFAGPPPLPTVDVKALRAPADAALKGADA